VSDSDDDVREDDAYGEQRARLRAVREVLDQEEDAAEGTVADDAALLALVKGVHAADLADLLDKLDTPGRTRVVGLLRGTLDPEVLSYLHESIRSEVMALLTPTELAEAINALDSDDAVDLLEDLDEGMRMQTLRLLNPIVRAAVLEGLSFPEESAGRLMRKEVFAVPLFWTVGKTIDYMRAASEDDVPDNFHELFVVDALYKVVGSLPVARILRSGRAARIEDICDRDVDLIPATEDQREVAFLFRRYGLVAAPVVDEFERLLGVITVDDVVHVIEEQAEDELFALSGVGDDGIYNAIKDTTKARLPWLGINLLTAVLSAGVIALFQSSIEKVVALAVLMPIVASMGGNAGTQALAVAVRALATRELDEHNAARVLWKEVAVGLLNGLALGSTAALVTGLVFGDVLLAVTIGMAMVFALLVAGLCGTLIPMILERFKFDPAVSSSVFLTTITDVVGFMTFLGLATLLVL
jgi:magnesium transporter